MAAQEVAAGRGVTGLDAALGLLAALVAWEWRVVRQDVRLALLAHAAV